MLRICNNLSGQLTVSCPSKIPAKATDYSSFVALGGVASDNCSEVTVSWVSDIISNQTCSNRYTVTRTYLATDAQGNSSTCEQIITVNDQTAPVIQTTPGSLDDILECSDTTAIALALALEPAAIDNCNDSPTLHLINDVTTPTIPVALILTPGFVHGTLPMTVVMQVLISSRQS